MRGWSPAGEEGVVAHTGDGICGQLLGQDGRSGESAHDGSAVLHLDSLRYIPQEWKERNV